MTDLNELKRLALAATPGPWQWASDWERAAVLASTTPYKRVVCSGNQNNSDRFGSEHWSGADWADAQFIAAANPTAILDLIAQLEQANRKLAMRTLIEEGQELDGDASPAGEMPDMEDACRASWLLLVAGGREDLRHSYPDYRSIWLAGRQYASQLALPAGPGPTFQWRSGDQVVMPAHSSGDQLVWATGQAELALSSPAVAQTVADEDSKRIDYLDALRQESAAKGFKWNTFQYDTDKPIRATIDAARAALCQPAEGAAIAAARAEGVE